MLFLPLWEDGSASGSSAWAKSILFCLVWVTRRWVPDWVGNGVWPWGILQQMCVWRKSLVLSLSCGNLEYYHQNMCFVFRKPYFSLKVYEHKNVLPALQKTLLVDGK